jgi:predicted DNA-binding protein (UPF0251 family)
MATTPKLQTEFKLKLSKALALSLHEWHRQFRAGEITLARFAEQIFESPIIDYRARQIKPAVRRVTALPGNVGGAGGRSKHGLTSVQEGELFELMDSNELTVAEAAERFGVGRSTIRRVLAKRNRINQ